LTENTVRKPVALHNLAVGYCKKLPTNQQLHATDKSSEVRTNFGFIHLFIQEVAVIQPFADYILNPIVYCFITRCHQQFRM